MLGEGGSSFRFRINFCSPTARPLNKLAERNNARPLGGEGHSQNGEGGSSFAFRINSRNRSHAP